MSPAMEMALIVTLTGLLAVVSAVAGALWWRVRSIPRSDPVDRSLERIERLLERLEGQTVPMPERRAQADSSPCGPRTFRRADLAEPTAVTGPTLITVPDLASPPSEASQAAAELGERFGAIWALADSGASPDSIARATGHPIGQVELILGLRRQLASAVGEARP